MFLVSKHCQILLHFYIWYSCNKNWRKKKPVPQTSQTLNLASKKYNLRKADGLKLYWNWMFFFLQKLICYKEDFTKLEVWWSPSKIDCEQKISYFWMKIVLFSYTESLQLKSLKETLHKYWIGNHVYLINFDYLK